MKRYFILYVLMVSEALCGCARPPRRTDVVYQVSTIDALLQGLYDGEITCGELKEHGDFGIGTFDRLDGEMVVTDGTVYQVCADGSVHIPDDNAKVPFAAMIFFRPDRTAVLKGRLDLNGLERSLDALLPTENIFYAVRAEGSFTYVKTRSVPAQDKPYPPLDEAVKKQRTFEFNNAEGTLVGLRCPGYMKGINVPAYHFHFITRDRRAGGHVLECRLEDARVAIDSASEFHMVLPHSGEFYRARLGRDAQSPAERAGKAKDKKAR